MPLQEGGEQVVTFFFPSPAAAGERGDSSKTLNDVGQCLSHLDSDACLKNPKALLPPVLTAGLAGCAGARSPGLEIEASSEYALVTFAGDVTHA